MKELLYPMLMAFSLFAGPALAGIQGWVDNANKTAAQMAYNVMNGSCDSLKDLSPNSASKCKSPSGHNDTLEGLHESAQVDEESYLALLAEDRKAALSCTQTLVDQISSNSETFRCSKRILPKRSKQSRP